MTVLTVPKAMSAACMGGLLRLSDQDAVISRCAKRFGVFAHRYNCRLCGLMFCSACSKVSSVGGLPLCRERCVLSRRP